MKCPNCGAIVEAFQTRCSSCGFELSGQKISESLQDFFSEIQKFDDLEYKVKSQNAERKAQDKTRIKIAKTNKKSHPIKTFFVVLLGVAAFKVLLERFSPSVGNFFAIHPLFPLFVLIGVILAVLGVLFVIKPKFTNEEIKKESYVKTFPIPASRQDLMEFACFAAEQIVHVNSFSKKFCMSAKKQEKWNEIWRGKCQQIYRKSLLSMVDDPNSLKTIKSIFVSAGIEVK